MKNNNKGIKTDKISYKQALTHNEIIYFAQLIYSFKAGNFDYYMLGIAFISQGITIEPVLHDTSTQMMTLDEYKDLKKRYEEEDYHYEDIDYFILNSDDYSNVYFNLDQDVIEMLANHGNPKFQEEMIDILNGELRTTWNATEEDRILRNKMKRQIKEYQKALEGKNHSKNRK